MIKGYGEPTTHGGHPTKLLVIRERDVGLFSMVRQVINTLFLMEDQRIDRIPVALFGRGLIYFDPSGHERRRSVWEYYFEPLVAEFPEQTVMGVFGDDWIDVMESKRKQLELVRGEIDFPDDLHLVPPLTDDDRHNIARVDELVSTLDWVWTDSFEPVIDDRRPSLDHIPDDLAADLMHRYIRPRAHIRDKASDLHRAQLEGYHQIGVHVRGTDGYSAPARGVQIDFDRYFAEIEMRLSEIGRDSCRVFLATDEEYVVDRFAKRFDDVLVCYDATRSTGADDPFGTGPTGQVVPGYIARPGADASKNGEDAVVEFTVLCESRMFVHNTSSLSDAVRLIVKDSVRVPGRS